ncbi:MAG: peptide ABC transporter permease [Alcanivorax sp.]|nr:peptide ABC transporter permease [Alcanivorax sp.]MAY11754.1 peptide ABC transporter permease [Alcanivorax sp.]MBI56173.1 peptide ABC transporter permease [Alcanivorax sp.]MBU58323.1 peptide ABC transporter permease [Alcanivorax sp.]UWN49769.1 Heme/hemopexin transporter protein HuxB [Alcanivorax sp. ALC70]
MTRTFAPFTVTALFLLAATPALAQTAPDAGQILQQNREPRDAPPAPSVDLRLDGEPLTEGKAGGARVTLDTITLEGNTVFSDARLHEVLDGALGEPRDLAGLQALANRLSRFYRDHGYPFALAILPAQDLSDGNLTLRIVEGRYDRARTSGPEPLASELQPWLAPLEPGTPIASAPLSRRLLLMGDLPGVGIEPVMRPGRRPGTGELEVRVRPTSRVTGLIGADNHGNRFSGEYRGRAGVAVNRLLTVGDKLDLSALYTSEDTWLGSLAYALPLGTSGLRGELSYARNDYTLGHGFEGYTGQADVYSARLRYPLLRRQQSNLTLFGGLRYKELKDDIDLFDYRKATDSRALPVGLNFDARDGLGLGGITWGRLTLTPGRIDIDQGILGDRDYGFTTVALDVSRRQVLGHGLDLYARFNGQWADRDDLDGSESFYLGGPNAVRAYPVGEGSDARGWLTQLELRYRAGKGWSPFIFHDTGRTPNGGVDQGEDRRVAGAGVGLRYARGGLSLSLTSAWKTDGGDAQSDDDQRDPQLWANLGYRF